MQNAYIALGSNLGNREKHLRAALDAIAALPTTDVLQTASLLETPPVDSPLHAGPYINTVTHIRTELSPEALLHALLSIERSQGRDRSAPDHATHRNAPRTLDLDVLLYEDRILETAALTLPHPRMHARRFVLQPLAEIAPEVIHPTLGKTIKSLLDTLL